MNVISAKPPHYLQIHEITKRYWKKTIFEQISFQFHQGDFVMLCGANGSGKSTFIKCLMKVISYEGQIKYPKQVRIGYAPEQYVIPEWMSCYEFLSILGRLKKDKQQMHTLQYYMHYFDIADCLHQKMKSLSNGTKQKINLIQALILEPSILILDEPLRALDELTRVRLVELLKLRKQKTLTIVSSHHDEYFDECYNHRIVFPLMT